MKKNLNPNEKYEMLKKNGLAGFEQLLGKVEHYEDTVTATLFVRYQDLSQEKSKTYGSYAWALTRVFPESMAGRFREIIDETVRKHGRSEATMTDAALKMLSEPGGILVSFSEDIFNDANLMSKVKNKEQVQSIVDKTSVKEFFSTPENITDATKKTIDFLKYRIGYKKEEEVKVRMDDSWKKYFADREAKPGLEA